MKRKLSIIIPVYNEETEFLDTMLSFFLPLKFTKNIEVIIVDDGSDLPVKEQVNFVTHIVRKEKNKGYGNSIKLGIRHASGNYIGIIDADSQYDPMELIELWEAMEDEDMLVGKRITHQGGWKRFFGRLSIKIISSFCALRFIPDLNSGVRIFKKHLARSYASLLCDEFSFTTSLTMCFLLDKLKVKWLPIGFYPRQGNPSTVKLLRIGLITLYQLIYLTIGLRTRKLRKWLRNN